jgi:transposase
LAHFAELIQPQTRPLPDAQSRELMALVARRRQVVEMMTAESNRHGRAIGSVKRAVAAHVRWLRKQLGELDVAVEQAMRHSPLWSERARLLRSVPAVGSVTVITLLAHLPDLGTLSRRKIAALVGVAPFNHDSGKLRGTRAIWGGRAQVRAVFLYVYIGRNSSEPASEGLLCATAFKKPKVALIACMRRFLIILNAVLRHQTPWSPEVAALPSPFSAALAGAAARRYGVAEAARRICDN